MSVFVKLPFTAAAAAAALTAPASVAQPPAATVFPLSKLIALRPCHVQGVKEVLRCGTFIVPENREKPSGRTLPLKVVVIPARHQPARSDPVFYFEGGPGQAATESASYVVGLYIRDHNNVVLVDQRGTGMGNRLDCPLPGSDKDIQGYLDPHYPAMKRCAASLSNKADLTQYTSYQAMQDIDAVRRAFGFDKINLYGGSYGSRAAIVYMRMYPQHVRTAYLSAAVPFEIRLPLYSARSVQRAFDASIADCAKDAECRRRYPDPRGDLNALLAQLRDQPAHVNIKHPATGKPVTVTLTEWGLATGLRFSLYTAEKPSTIPSLLRRARLGDLTPLTEAAIRANRGSREGMHFGMNAAVVCSEDVARIDPKDVERESEGTFVGTALADNWIDLCKAWPKASFPPDFFTPSLLEIPVLISSGELDPATPPQWGEVVRKQFPNSTHIVVHQGHHFDEKEGCLGELAAEFLKAASVHDLDTRCLQSSGAYVAR